MLTFIQETIWNRTWLGANIGQALGAGFGALVAFAFGYWQAMLQINRSERPEKVRLKKIEYKFLMKINRVIRFTETLMCDPRSGNKELQKCIKEFIKYSDEWWKVIDEPKISERLDTILYSMQLLHSNIKSGKNVDLKKNLLLLKDKFDIIASKIGKAQIHNRKFLKLNDPKAERAIRVFLLKERIRLYWIQFKGYFSNPAEL